jgi:glutathione synthase/RimK-type ligase-like ATP-grasp enzyme
MKADTCLLVNDPSEFNCHKLEMMLRQLGTRVVVLDPTFCDRNFEYSLRIGAQPEEHLYDRNGQAVPLESVRSVWTRGVSYAGYNRPALNSSANLALAEAKHAGNYLWSRLANRFWMNPVPALVDTNRLVQLRAALRLGLRVPESIVTTRGRDAAEFARAHGECVIKPICQGGKFESGPGVIMCSRFEAGCAIDEVLSAPVLVQQMVAKSHELRVAIVGDQVFSGALESTLSEKTLVDSRSWLETDLTYFRMPLSKQEEASLVALNGELGLVYSSMDLIRTPAGELVFLEANPSGQWTFLEAQTGFAITEAMARLLAGKARPAALEEVA